MSDPISRELSYHIGSMRRFKVRRWALTTLTDARFTAFLIVVDTIFVCWYAYNFISDCLDGSPGWAIWHLILAVWFMKFLRRDVRHYRRINGLTGV